MHRFNGGEEQAFAEITTRHRERMFSVAFAMLRNNADAEEIVQDTFIRAYRGLATFRGDSSLACWLHRIAVNLARNRYWYFFRRRRHLSISIDMLHSGHEHGDVLRIGWRTGCRASRLHCRTYRRTAEAPLPDAWSVSSAPRRCLPPPAAIP